MSNLRYTPEMAGDVARAYNELLESVPHCYPVSDTTFAATAALPLCVAETTDRERLAHPRVSLAEPAAWIAWRDDQVVGFVDVACTDGDGQSDRLGVVRSFWYTRGYRRDAQELLRLGLRHLRHQSASTVQACAYEHRYPFYHVEHAGLTDRLAHVRALLELRGMKQRSCQVVLDWRDYAVYHDEPPLQCEIAVEPLAGHDSEPGLKVSAVSGGQTMGFTVVVSGADYAGRGRAADWAYTPWLWVDEPYRGKGLGRHLLLASLQAMHELGARHACLCAGSDNHAAILLYGNLGYRAVDWTTTWEMPL